ncbi:thioredoxin O1, mitochondrial isoform X1 [Vigna unguiculata]|uniref:thioredoxin O1, mitochondrial isoform X1 n=2 Tax=Vigna unguiculata TaxID=3917 RepID=UPI001015CAC6|nr:thioredoxin O1, mitochondrial isoform X1 [Vigna unguiculata]
MARNWLFRSLALRHAIKNSVRPIFSSAHHRFLSLPSKPALFATAIASSQLSLLPSFRHSRSLSSVAGSSDVVLVNSEEEFNNILTKVQDNSLHAIFYFTAVWCGPCRFISPIVGELSKKYPHVTTYKIDIDQEAIQGTLSKLQITSVPTLHFFQNGKKADVLIGADVARLTNITEKLFKKN